MGHKRIEETMGYVHVASTHMRELPENIIKAGESEKDPDRRVLRMLGARGNMTATAVRATGESGGTMAG
jgi:hypothetical protein